MMSAECRQVNAEGEDITHSFLYDAELLELLAKRILISVPCEASVDCN